MNVVLLVVDSMRAASLGIPDGPRTPFLDRLSRTATHFRRAHATECWTLPTHMSMFTGLRPSQHGAHFQSMGYQGAAPTVAELLAAAGHHTEVVTRNSLFDGTVPGATRGFRENTQVLADLGRLATPAAFVLALARPRVRRLISTSGFFHALQRDNREFLHTLARMGIPADARALEYTLERMRDHRRRAKPYFYFLNLYDVHAPYSPTPTSPFRSFTTPAGWAENLALPWVLPRVSSHSYLRPGFRMPDRSRKMLLARYHAAIELMDAKLAAFYDAAKSGGLLDDTLLIVTADHGEAFGEHALYFHDASVYQTHLHVPLWVHHPEVPPTAVDDVVSTMGLFDLMRSVGSGQGIRGTLLDPSARAAGAVALAEHFHYPHTADVLDCYRQNIAAAVVGARKLVVGRDGVRAYDLGRDPEEAAPMPTTVADFAAACRRDGASAAAIERATAHARGWEINAAAA